MRDVAILVDGGFFLRRIRSLGHLDDPPRAEPALDCLARRRENHLAALNRRYGLAIPPDDDERRWRPLTNRHGLLYRVFFYDAPPFMGRAHFPISKRAIDFAKTEQASFRRDLFVRLRKTRDVALRLGELAGRSRWILREDAQRRLLRREITLDELTDDDFDYDLKQKGVDMRIGLDISSLTLKKQVKVIVLVTGDADFVPAAKLARREGVEIILDPLGFNVSDALFEHIDGLRHGLARVDQPGAEPDAAVPEND